MIGWQSPFKKLFTIFLQKTIDKKGFKCKETAGFDSKTRKREDLVDAPPSALFYFFDFTGFSRNDGVFRPIMKRTILVADDEQGFRDMFTFLLVPLGFEVLCVENGQEAVEKIKEREFGVVIMDVHMPILTGPEALKKIQMIRPEQKVIILASSSDDAHHFEEEFGGRVVECLYKPVEISEIQRVLEKALGPFPKH